MNSKANWGLTVGPSKFRIQNQTKKMSGPTPSDIKESAYGVFVQVFGRHHKHAYPDEMIEEKNRRV